MYTGLIYGWSFVGERIYGRMEAHESRPNLNGKQCRTSKVLTISMRNGDRVARTASGSTYKLVD